MQVNWRIVNVEVAATMAAETMNSSGTGTVSADISKLRRDVLKQAIASLAGFIGSVNYSNSFHVAAAAQASREAPPLAEAVPVAATDEETPPAFNDNPLYDEEKMSSAVEHANKVTRTYGVEIMSINIISATPCDQALTRALASGAVASAEALQAETAARGQARAISIAAEAEASRCKIAAEGEANLVGGMRGRWPWKAGSAYYSLAGGKYDTPEYVAPPPPPKKTATKLKGGFFKSEKKSEEVEIEESEKKSEE